MVACGWVLRGLPPLSFLSLTAVKHYQLKVALTDHPSIHAWWFSGMEVSSALLVMAAAFGIHWEMKMKLYFGGTELSPGSSLH